MTLKCRDSPHDVAAFLHHGRVGPHSTRHMVVPTTRRRHAPHHFPRLPLPLANKALVDVSQAVGAVERVGTGLQKGGKVCWQLERVAGTFVVESAHAGTVAVHEGAAVVTHRALRVGLHCGDGLVIDVIAFAGVGLDVGRGRGRGRGRWRGWTGRWAAAVDRAHVACGERGSLHDHHDHLQPLCRGVGPRVHSLLLQYRRSSARHV
jgi:hypothetical protein